MFADNSIVRRGGFFWPDEKTIYFSQDSEIRVSRRASATRLFGEGTPLPSQAGYTPILAQNGLSLYYATIDGVLMVATREAITQEFSPPEMLSNILPYAYSPYLAGNDTVLYYDAYTDDAYADVVLDGRGVHRTELSDVGSLPSEFQITTTAGLASSSVVVSNDELTLYFSTSLDNPERIDLYAAVREHRDATFSEPKRVVELNSDVLHTATSASWLSADGCRIVIDRDGYVMLAIKPK